MSELPDIPIRSAAEESDRLVREFSSGATPEDVFRWVVRHNGDNSNDEALIHELLEDPGTDAGIALAAYRIGGASCYAGFASDEAVPDFRRDTGRWIRLIGQRLEDGFYRESRVAFGLRDISFADLYEPDPVRAHPPATLRPVEGEYVDLDDPDFDDGLPVDLQSRIFELYDLEAES